MAQHVHKERSFDAFLSSTPILSELLEHIDVGTKWYFLGTLLHVDEKRLNGIEQLQGHDDTSKTLKMFQHWLTTTPTASRGQVLEALRKRVVNEHTVADKYEKYLKELHDTTYTPPSTEAVSIFQRNIQSLNEALVSPVQVSQLLYCKRCISEATLDEMERMDQRRSLDDKKTVLLTAMQETVSSDYRKLKDIAIALSDIEQTRFIAIGMLNKYEEKIPQDDDSTVVKKQQQEVAGSDEGHASDILRNNYSALSLSITEPVRVAKCLHEEVISDEALSCVMSTRGSVSDSRAVLLKAVRDAVRSNYKHLELFVTVLRKFSETAHIGDTVFEEYRKRFNYGNIEEDEIYVANQKSMSTSSESSSLDDDTHGDHKILFPRDMKNKFEDMRMKFGSTFFKVRRIFTKMKSILNIDEVKELIIIWFPDLKPQLSYTGTIEEVLNVLKRKCSIFNVRPLENLAFEFNIEDAKPVLKSFKEEAKDFCKSVSVSLSLGEELQAVATPSRLLSETVVFVFNWNPDDYTLQDINAMFFELEPLNRYHIQMDKIGTGQSVVVTCYCPAEYTGSLIMAVLDKIQILQKKGLKEFVVSKCSIWNATEVVSVNRDVKDLLIQIHNLKTALKDRDEKITASETELSKLKEQLKALKISLEESQCINGKYSTIYTIISYL
uniref:Death domain-containing protein n=1 Tax=Amphimedon queenslandica TaxID=400682 RepID=A0A1X7TF21_AMPQE